MGHNCFWTPPTAGLLVRLQVKKTARLLGTLANPALTRPQQGHGCEPNWVGLLVSEPDFFFGFCSFPWKSNSFTRIEAQEQRSLLDRIFDYTFYFEPPGKYLYLSP